MKIEVPELSDFAEIMVLAQQAHALHVRLRPDIFTPTEIPMNFESFRESREKGQILIVREEKRILGYALFQLQERVLQSGTVYKRLWADVLCTREDARGRGVGRMLMERLRDYGKREGCARLALTVTCENTDAIRFYEGLGLQKENIRYSLSLEA